MDASFEGYAKELKSVKHKLRDVERQLQNLLTLQASLTDRHKELEAILHKHATQKQQQAQADTELDRQVSGIPSACPKLACKSSTFLDHDYSFAGVRRPLVECFQSCMDGVRLLEKHEDDLLMTDIFQRGKTFLPELERAFRDLARSGACDGMLYLMVFSHGATQLARTVQYGTMAGALQSSEVERLVESAFGQSLLYQVFSDADLTLNRKRKSAGSTRDFSSKTYKYYKQKIEGPLKALQATAMSGTCLKGGALLLLKKNSRKKTAEDRFFCCFGSNPGIECQLLEKALLDHRTWCGPRPALIRLRDIGQMPTLQEQLEAIGSIDHDTDRIPTVIGHAYMKAERVPYFPGSFLSSKKVDGILLPVARRPRLCYFALKDEWLQVERLLCGQLADVYSQSRQPLATQLTEGPGALTVPPTR